jgi:hypothetical protein
MNQSMSDLDELTPDDEAGLHFLYPAGAPASSVVPQAVTQVQQGSGGGGGNATTGGQRLGHRAGLLPVADVRLAAPGVLSKSEKYRKCPDTVGQPPRAEIGVPNMPSWKAKSGSFHETTKVVNSLRISTAGITMKA